jgi:hypothetical protein
MVGKAIRSVNKDFAKNIQREDRAIANDLKRETNRMASAIRQAEKMK